MPFFNQSLIQHYTHVNQYRVLNIIGHVSIKAPPPIMDGVLVFLNFYPKVSIHIAGYCLHIVFRGSYGIVRKATDDYDDVLLYYTSK